MADFTYDIHDWATGVVQSIEGDKLPSGALTSALNTQFWHVGGGRSAIGTRPGLRLATEFIDGVMTTPSEFRHIQPYQYPANSDVAHTRYMACVSGDGRLFYKEQDDGWDGEVLTPPATYPNPSTCIPADSVDKIDATVMNGRLIYVAGATRRSLFGKTYQPFGVQAPQGTAQAAQIGGGVAVRLPADTYSIYITAYESTTGVESNPTYLGDVITSGDVGGLTGTNPTGVIAVSLASTGVVSDKWRIYIQRQSTQAQAYLLTDVYTSADSQVSSDGDIAVTDDDVVVNVSAVILADLIRPVPLGTENSEMPGDAVYVATYGRRLIAASRRKLYWSKLDVPDAFPPENFEIIDTGEGDEIVGLMPMSGEQLLVFTTTSVWVLEGIDPQYWTFKPLDNTVGCAGRKSIVRFDNDVAWWSPQYGPVVMRSGQIDKIAYDLLGRERIEQISPFQWQNISGGWDPVYEHIVWAVPDVGDVDTTILLPYNHRLNKWAAEYWDPLTVNCMTTGFDNHGRQRLFMMDDSFRLYYLDNNALYDGLPGGTATGAFAAGSGEISAITGTGFYNQSVGATTKTLAKQRVTIVDADGHLVGRRTITSSNATTLNLDRSVLVTSGQTYTYYVSTPYMSVMTNWMDNDQPFLRKRHDRLYLDTQCSDSAVPIIVDVQLNNNDQTNVLTLEVLSSTVQTATTNATWDVPVITTQPFAKQRHGVWKNAHNCRIVLSQPKAAQAIVSKLTLTGRMLNDRYYS